MSVARNLNSWRAAARTFERPAGAVAYWQEGEGAPLLLLHGWPSSSWDWRGLWPALARDRRLIALDLPGFGLSAKPRSRGEAGPYSVRALADLVEALCAHLEVTSADVLCHDISAVVVQELLARQGEDAASVRVRSMLALNGAFLPAAHKPPNSAPGPLASITGGGAAERFKRAYASGFPEGRKPKKAELNNAWRLHEAGGGGRGGFRLDRLRTEQQTHRDRWLGVLRAGLVPQRFVIGLADPTLAPRAAADYRAALPGADFVLLDASGRYPHLDAPEDVLEAFEMFQAGLSEELTPR